MSRYPIVWLLDVVFSAWHKLPGVHHCPWCRASNL
jgi:hypothetical protein